jgi:hypothetical protein
MKRNIKVQANITKKIKKLSTIAQDLRNGKSFNITRLTTIKSLCKDPETASHFVLYIAKLTIEKMEEKEPNYLSSKRWITHKKLVEKAIQAMENYLRSKEPKENEELKKIWRGLRELQSKYENQRWGPVRILESRETLLVEKALECMITPEQSGFWSYHVARDYTEQYDPRYGTGLLPKSAPMVEDIINFWNQCYEIDTRSDISTKKL